MVPKTASYWTTKMRTQATNKLCRNSVGFDCRRIESTFRKILTVLSCVILSTRMPLKALRSRHQSQPSTTHVTVAVLGFPYMRLSSPKLTPGKLI